MSRDRPNEQALRSQYGEEIECVAQRFERGLRRIADRSAMRRAYDTFSDPIYSPFIQGFESEFLSRMFFTFWRVGQTFATQARFWLEEAIADLLILRYRTSGKFGARVYTQPMLAAGWYTRNLSVADFGDEEREALVGNSVWEVPLQSSALQQIDVIVGKEERRIQAERLDTHTSTFAKRIAEHADRQAFAECVSSLTGPPAELVKLQCNLLVIEPDYLDGGTHAWAIRFVNARTLSSPAIRKQERVNLLRLHTYVSQEKVLRDPSLIATFAAELTPRKGVGQKRHPDYFTPHSYRTCQGFWDFLELPFDIVPLGIRDAAGRIRLEFGDAIDHAMLEDDV